MLEFPFGENNLMTYRVNSAFAGIFQNWEIEIHYGPSFQLKAAESGTTDNPKLVFHK